MIGVFCCVLYGSDFVEDSIRSILPVCDDVYVVMVGRPWGDTTGVVYKGDWVPWPEKFDDSRERVAAMNEPRVHIIDNYWPLPHTQCLHAMNDLVLPLYKDVRAIGDVLIMSSDCVFEQGNLEQLMRSWRKYAHAGAWAYATQRELWRTPAWTFERRQQRSSVNLHRPVSWPTKWPRGGLQPTPIPMLEGTVHSFGFCMSPAATRWKMLTAMAYAPIVGESPPNEDWFEKKWLSWHPVMNNRNLEISARSESDISHAVPYDVTLLPESIQKRYAASEWQVQW